MRPFHRKSDEAASRLASQEFSLNTNHKEDDLYVAECPELGVASQGHTVEEAVANLKEATELYLEEFPLPEVDNLQH